MATVGQMCVGMASTSSPGRKRSAAGVSTYGSLTDQLTRYILRKNGLVPEKDVQIMQVGATVSAPEMREALDAARELDRICADADLQVALHVAFLPATAAKNRLDSWAHGISSG